MVNTTSKDILARLLATENVTVVHANVKTASFNVKDRVLTLPVWEDMTNEVYDLLVGHEVGHALWTGADGWHDAVCDRGPEFKTYLNVIEDARIEKLIQRKYPGLRRSFIAAYKKMFADGFFGVDADMINDLGLIDRINTRFKCGESLGVRFTAEELPYIAEIENAETWEEVVDIAERLYDKALEEKENEPEPEYDDGEGEEFEPTDGEGDDNAPEDNDGDDQGDADADAGGDEESDAEEAPEEGESNEYDMGDDGVGSVTDGALRKAMENEYNGDVQVTNFFLNNEPVNDRIVGYKEILNEYAETDEQIFTYGAEMFKKFMVNNKKTINYIVKEFEMKKRASEYARTTLAKTGVIDPVKMNSYKFSDDIFRKMSVTPDGKNHGLVMFLDWSGSMYRDMKNTIDQTLNLVMFCRQVNIPFRVYAFSTAWNETREDIVYPESDVNKLVYGENFDLLELFSDKMKRNELQRMAGTMLKHADQRSSDRYSWQEGYVRTPRKMELGATPLDKTVMAAIQIYTNFKKDYRLDIVNTVFLTDGDSHDCEVVRSNGTTSYMYYMLSTWGDQRYYIVDPATKKRYRLNVRSHGGRTKTFLEIFRDRTGSNAIGFRILPKNINSVSGLFGQTDRMRAELKKDKVTTINGRGYTKFFGIRGGKDLEVANGAIEVAQDASKAKIRTAFKKASAGKLTSRVLLNQMVELIS